MPVCEAGAVNGVSSYDRLPSAPIENREQRICHSSQLVSHTGLLKITEMSEKGCRFDFEGFHRCCNLQLLTQFKQEFISQIIFSLSCFCLIVTEVYQCKSFCDF